MQKAIRRILAAAAFLAGGFTVAAQTYYIQGLHRQGNAEDARNYLRIYGSNLFFWGTNTIPGSNIVGYVLLSTNAIYSDIATNWVGSNTVWRLTGNTLSAPGPFLGSLDAVPVRFRVNNNAFGQFGTDKSIALGLGSTAADFSAIAIGDGASAQGIASIAVGYLCNGQATGSTALGYHAIAQNSGSFVYHDATATAYSDTAAHQFVVYASGGIDLHSAGAGMSADGTARLSTVLATNSVTGSNFVTSVVKWVDIPMNYAFSVTGPNAPSLTAVTNSSLIQELAFDNNDILYAQAQFSHTVAITNAAFPNFYFEPHVHFTTIGTLDSTHSNVTWRIEWQVAAINGPWYSGTNSVTSGVSSNHIHYMAELGHITNNTLGISAIFRCRLTRPASAAQDYSNAHDVLLDGFDLHLPIGNRNAIGSSTDAAP